MEELKKYILKNCNLLDLVRDLNSWNGCLDWLDYQINDDEFFNVYFNNNVLEAVRAVCYGEYNYCDDYVKFNGYGNLESCKEYELEEELKDNIDEIIDALLDNYEQLNYLDNELIEKIEEYLEEE